MMNRRDSLKLLVISPAAAAALSSCTPGAEQAHDHDGATVGAMEGRLMDGRLHEPPMFFTEHEYATVHKLVDYIIPADDQSGSATEAGVPEFIDFTALDLDEPEALQTRLRGGLAWLDFQCNRRFNQPFVDCEDAQCREMLDLIAYPEQAEPGMEPGVAFFNLMRDMTATGFFSSQMGVEDLQYQGNIVVGVWEGVPQEVLDHVGVNYDDWSHLGPV